MFVAADMHLGDLCICPRLGDLVVETKFRNAPAVDDVQVAAAIHDGRDLKGTDVVDGIEDDSTESTPQRSSDVAISHPLGFA